MKKFFLACILTVIAFSSCAHLTQLPLDGEYASFTDSRDGDMCYTSYMYLKNEGKELCFILRRDNYDDGSFLLFKLFINEKNGKVSVSRIEQFADFEFDKNKAQLFADDFINLFQFSLLNQSKITESVDLVYNDKLRKSKYTLKCLPSRQIFQMLEMKDSNNEIVMQLNKSGFARTEDEFIDFIHSNPVDIEKNLIQRRTDEKIKISKAKEMNVVLNGYEVKLDENWMPAAQSETGFPYGGYKIALASHIRDSIISIEIVDLEKMNMSAEENYRYLAAFYLTSIPTAKTTKNDDGVVTIEAYMLDEHKFLNRCIHRIRKIDNKLVLMNFSSFYDIYIDNKDYFDNIIANFNWTKAN